MIKKNQITVRDYEQNKDLWNFLYEVEIPNDIVSTYFNSPDSAREKISVFVRIDYDNKKDVLFKKKLDLKQTSEKLVSFVSTDVVLPEKQKVILLSISVEIPEYNIVLANYRESVLDYDDYRFDETEQKERFFKKDELLERLKLPTFFEPNNKQSWLSDVFQTNDEENNCLYFFIDLEKYFKTVYEFPNLILDKKNEIKNSLFIKTDSSEDIVTEYYDGTRLFFSVISKNSETTLSIFTLDRTKELVKELFTNLSRKSGIYYDTFIKNINNSSTRERITKNVLEQISLIFPEITGQFYYNVSVPSKNFSLEYEKKFIKQNSLDNIFVEMNLNPRMSFQYYQNICEAKSIQEFYQVSTTQIVSEIDSKFSFLTPTIDRFSENFISPIKVYENPFNFFYDMFIKDTKTIFETQEQLLSQNGINIFDLSEIVQSPKTSFEIFLGTPKEKETNIHLTENNEKNIKFSNIISNMNLRLLSDWIGFEDVNEAFKYKNVFLPNGVLKVMEKINKKDISFYDQEGNFRYYLLPLIYLNYLLSVKVEYMDFNSEPKDVRWKLLRKDSFDNSQVLFCRITEFKEQDIIPKFFFEKKIVFQNSYFILTKEQPLSEQILLEQEIQNQSFFDKEKKNNLDKTSGPLSNELQPFVEQIKETIDKL